MVLECGICHRSFENLTFRQTCSKECKRELQRNITREQFADPSARQYHQDATRHAMADLDMKEIVRTRRRSYKGESHPSYGMERTPEWRENISQGNTGKLKGKTWDEIMGPERAAIRRAENSDAMIDTNCRLLNDRSSELEKRIASYFPEFQRNQKLGKWVVDLVNHEMKLIVEVNGDYWHGNPRVYPTDAYIPALGMTVGEKNAADGYRNDQLRQMGYRVVVLWELDVKDETETMIRTRVLG